MSKKIWRKDNHAGLSFSAEHHDWIINAFDKISEESQEYEGYVFHIETPQGKGFVGIACSHYGGGKSTGVFIPGEDQSAWRKAEVRAITRVRNLQKKFDTYVKKKGIRPCFAEMGLR